MYPTMASDGSKKRESGPPRGVSPAAIDNVGSDSSNARAAQKVKKPSAGRSKIREIGGPESPEPTRYGDWERKGRCVDF